VITSDWKERLITWEGTASEMAAALTGVEDASAWSGTEPSVRLIRHYTQLSVLDRPERRGKEAYYGYRQIVQYLAARWLLQDGWMLAKIAEVTATRTTAELIALLPGAPKNPAQALIQRFKQSSSPSSEAVTSRQAQLLQQRSRLQQVLPDLGNPGGVVQRRDRVQLSLTDWCQVLIDADRLPTLSPEESTRLGEALAAALNEASRTPIRKTASRARSPHRGKKKK
jgi:DNA-binding transcriptional MerR regulator